MAAATISPTRLAPPAERHWGPDQMIGTSTPSGEAGKSRFRVARERRELTQQQVADRCELSLKTIKRYDAGGRPRSIEIAQRLAEVLDQPLRLALATRRSPPGSRRTRQPPRRGAIRPARDPRPPRGPRHPPLDSTSPPAARPVAGVGDRSRHSRRGRHRRRAGDHGPQAARDAANQRRPRAAGSRRSSRPPRRRCWPRARRNDQTTTGLRNATATSAHTRPGATTAAPRRSGVRRIPAAARRPAASTRVAQPASTTQQAAATTTTASATTAASSTPAKRQPADTPSSGGGEFLP